MVSYISVHTVGLLSLTLLAVGCDGALDPGAGNGSTGASGAGGAGGGAASSSAGPGTGAGATSSSTGAGATSSGTGASAGAGGSGAATSSSTGGGVSVLACSSAGISFAIDVAPRLKEGCAMGQCHQMAFETPEGTYAYLVGKASKQCEDGRLNVAPGNPESSYLIDKITNQDLCDGNPMPKSYGNGGWTPLPSADIQTIYDWICSGAKND